ncbi:hypothetical protein HanXRQr2_Chr09g0397851 [Helianthus annuus]|uniref:Uncharacterized protein n=1 Tax=Helianthus annuus TaxID=4232 RepID=A0A9K3N9S7_HELAN|nr:hypothetical protein HanXRQr2_Chr09g0397851 [Helianthus annuus]KAJ0543126.1 hypothetical protein HanHA89_Chr09g0347341 [Helianthus annuus]KAJ0708178.1 hypothetical protein HanLR1_Chr09g0326651 [Helianthus annuus]KAJ0893954.1 hypothetical protein HanPSC8_Chr09g0383601 [Helianthus annuus]
MKVPDEFEGGSPSTVAAAALLLSSFFFSSLGFQIRFFFRRV